jgi:hypothetical protein
VRSNVHTNSESSRAANPDFQSPYGGRAIEVLIGHKQELYIVPSNLARQIPCLRPGCEFDGIVQLRDVNEDVGHTFMHFLYTGEYKTAKSPSAAASATAPDDTTATETEYNRSVLAYQAAISCGLGLEGLAEHARDCMQVLDNHIPIFDIISLGRDTMAKINDAWFSKYLTDRIITSFEEDEGIFQEEEFFELFGQSVAFDQFLSKVMAQAYETKLASIRDEAHSAIMEAELREDVWRDWEELSACEDVDEDDSSEHREGEQDNNDNEAADKTIDMETQPKAESDPAPEPEPEQEQSEEPLSVLVLVASADKTSDENEKDSWKPDPAVYDFSGKIYPMHCSKWRDHFTDESCHACNSYLESVAEESRW